MAAKDKLLFTIFLMNFAQKFVQCSLLMSVLVILFYSCFNKDTGQMGLIFFNCKSLSAS